MVFTLLGRKAEVPPRMRMYAFCLPDPARCLGEGRGDDDIGRHTRQETRARTLLASFHRYFSALSEIWGIHALFLAF